MVTINLDALAASQSRTRLMISMTRMFDALRPFMYAYTKTPEDQAKLPELDMVWVTDIYAGPDKVVLDAIKESPEMWGAAVPDECCIVPRDMLKRAVQSDMVCEALVHHGRNMVEAAAAKARYEREERERSR